MGFHPTIRKHQHRKELYNNSNANGILVVHQEKEVAAQFVQRVLCVMEVMHLYMQMMDIGKTIIANIILLRRKG